MQTYRVAILGCRSRGSAQARAYHAHPRTEVVGLCDLISERVNSIGDELGVAARFDDLDEMIRKTRPDIVAIPTGTEFHYDLTMRVLEHGVHIDVEKPMTVDLIQADAVLAKAKEKGVQIAVHHQWRLSAWTQAIAQAFQAGQIGDLRYMFASGKGYYGGYGLLNIGTHLLNQLLKFAGPCHSVAAQITTDGHPITPADVLPSPGGMGTIAGEYISASLQFDHNVTASLLQHRFDKIDLDAHIVELYGSEGRLLWYPQGAWWLPHPHTKPGGDDRWQRLNPIYPNSYALIGDEGDLREGDYWFVEEYVNALDQGRDHECNGEEGRHVIEIMMGMFESTIQETVVKLPQPNRTHPLLSWRTEAGSGEPAPMPRDYGSWLAAEDKRLGR